MLADISSNAIVVPGTEVNDVEDMTGDLELDAASVLYVSGEESIQQVISAFNTSDKGASGKRLNLLINFCLWAYSSDWMLA